MKVIIGLGNPGLKFKGTRHNIGFSAVDAITEKYNIEFNKKKFGGLYCETVINGENVVFLKPNKYINLSGEVIKKYIDYFKISIDDILVIHDDLDTSLGKYKLRQTGGSGGHNGLKNIELNVGTNEYKRIKIGISNNKEIETSNYVLGKISNDESKVMNKVVEDVKNIVDDFFVMSFLDLMNKYNKK